MYDTTTLAPSLDPLELATESDWNQYLNRYLRLCELDRLNLLTSLERHELERARGPIDRMIERRR